MSGGQTKLRHISCTHANGYKYANVSAAAQSFMDSKLNVFMTIDPPSIKSFSVWGSPGGGLDKYLELGRRVFGPVTPLRVVAGAPLRCRGCCSQCGRWRLCGGCRGTSGADAGGEDRTDSEPIKEHAKTTVSTILCPYQNETSHIRRKWFWLMLVHWPVRELTLA